MRYLLIILFGLISSKGLGCDCHSSVYKPFQNSDFEKVDLIFLAEIGEGLDSGLFEVKVMENYKGEFNSKIKILNPHNDYCSYYVKTGEKWLIYTYQNEYNIIVIDGCSRSRNIEKTKYLVPPPPPFPGGEQQKKYEVMYEKYLKSDRGFIDDELNQLRITSANKR